MLASLFEVKRYKVYQLQHELEEQLARAHKELAWAHKEVHALKEETCILRRREHNWGLLTF